MEGKVAPSQFQVYGSLSKFEVIFTPIYSNILDLNYLSRCSLIKQGEVLGQCIQFDFLSISLTKREKF